MVKLKVEIGKQFNTLSINENSICFLSTQSVINLRLLQDFIDDFDDNYKDVFKTLSNDSTRTYMLCLKLDKEYIITMYEECNECEN